MYVGKTPPGKRILDEYQSPQKSVEDSKSVASFDNNDRGKANILQSPLSKQGVQNQQFLLLSPEMKGRSPNRGSMAMQPRISILDVQK